MLSSDDVAIALYVLAAARMDRRGADPEAVLPLPLRSSQALQAAHRAALASQVGAQRRQEARRRKGAAMVRAAERDEWHARYAGDEVAWKARLADISGQESGAIERALLADRHLAVLDRIGMAFLSIRGAEHRTRMRAGGKPVLRPKRARRRRRSRPTDVDQIDLAIPW